MIPYDESKSVDFGNGINQANNEFFVIHGYRINDGGMTSVMSQRAAWDFYVGGLDWHTSKTKHLNEYRAQYGLPAVVDPIPPTASRGPLAPFPPPVTYRTELPWDPPHERDFLRADSWGVVIPDAPVVPGSSTKHPERILSWFVDRYEADFRKRYLQTYASYGYTHLKLSYADSCGPVDNGPNSPPGNGHSLEQFIETCLEVKRYLPYVQVVIGSKYFQPRNMTAAQWASFADPIMDALHQANAVDEWILGWEWDLWNTPGEPTISAFKHAGQKAHAAGRSFWMHYSPHVTSWFKDGDPRGRFGFYDDIAPDVDGLNYQTFPTWTVEDMQARIVDSLWQFGKRGNDVKFRLDEDQAALMFDQDKPDSEDANVRGYLACCTIDNVRWTDAKVWGFGNGARRVDGSPL